MKVCVRAGGFEVNVTTFSRFICKYRENGVTEMWMDFCVTLFMDDHQFCLVFSLLFLIATLEHRK